MAQYPAINVTHGIGAFILVSTCFAMSTAFAQSPDCKTPATPIKRAICEDQKLAAFNAQLDHDLRQLLAAQPAMRETYFEDEREWIRERDHHCTGANEERPLNDCLAAEYTARLSDIRSRMRLATQQIPPRHVSDQRAHPPLCKIIADRYRPLAHLHPGEPPLDVLAGSPDSGIQLEKGTDSVSMPTTKLAAWARSQKPPFSIPPAVLYSVEQYEKPGGSADIFKAPGAAFYTISVDQEGEDCPYSQSFVVRRGVGVPADTPGEPGEDGACPYVHYGTLDNSPIGIEQHYDWQPGLSATLEVWNWNGEGFSPDCEIELTYKPHFSANTRAPAEESCNGSDCNELRSASFALAESAESDLQAFQDSATERLTAKQQEQFDSMQELFAQLSREPLSLDPVSLPYLFHDRLLLVSIGHYAGPREHQYADWSVVFFESDDGKLVLRGSFPVGTSKGDLDDVTIKEK
jgi:uncharacterized protein YecT (DUF1311 family)